MASIAAPAALPQGPRPTPGQISGEPGPGREARVGGPRAMGPVPRPTRSRPRPWPQRPGFGGLSLADRRAEGFTLRTGAENALPGVIQTSRKGMEGAPGGVNGHFSHWHRETARDTV